MGNNVLKNKLNNKENIFGTIVCIGDMTVTEAISQTGYDVIWIDCEHSLISGLTLQNNLIATRAGGTSAWVRIPWNDPVLAKPVLDEGADGIIFPYVRNAQEAKLAVSACEYPPKGIRGYGPMRACNYGEISQKEFVNKVYRECLRIIQIEHIDAINDLENIVKVDGIDAFVFGPNDLSGSIGMLGDVKAPEMMEIYKKSAEILKKSGIPFGVATFYDKEWLKMWMDLGATIFFVGNDYSFIHDGSKKLLNDLKNI